MSSRPEHGTRESWRLRLYVAGATPNSTRALASLLAGLNVSLTEETFR